MTRPPGNGTSRRCRGSWPGRCPRVRRKRSATNQRNRSGRTQHDAECCSRGLSHLAPLYATTRKVAMFPTRRRRLTVRLGHPRRCPSPRRGNPQHFRAKGRGETRRYSGKNHPPSPTKTAPFQAPFPFLQGNSGAETVDEPTAVGDMDVTERRRSTEGRKSVSDTAYRTCGFVKGECVPIVQHFTRNR